MCQHLSLYGEVTVPSIVHIFPLTLSSVLIDWVGNGFGLCELNHLFITQADERQLQRLDISKMAIMMDGTIENYSAR